MAFVSGILLAAGLSARMGRKKLLLPFGRGILLDASLAHIIHSKADEIIIVVSPESGTEDAVRSFLRAFTLEREIKIVVNKEAADGIASSVRLAVARASEKADGFMFLLGDMPFVFPEFIDRVIDAFGEDSAFNIVPLYKGRRGHPVLIAKKWKSRLLETIESRKAELAGGESAGDFGARDILKQYPEEVRFTDIPFESPLLDVDDREDYEIIKGRAAYLPENRLLTYLHEGGQTCVSVSGGGGKTSLMIFLSNLFKRSGVRVLITTTTKLLEPGRLDYGFDSLHTGPVWDVPASGVKPGDLWFWYAGVSENGERVTGPPAEELESVYRQGIFDVILLETDGSAGRPVKFPGKNEPVIPPYADVCVHVIGLSGYGKPADEGTVHRLYEYREYFSEKPFSTGPGPINMEILAAIIEHPFGAFKNAPAGCGKLAVFNQCDMVSVEERLKLKEYILKNTGIPEGLVFTALEHHPELVEFVLRGKEYEYFR